MHVPFEQVEHLGGHGTQLPFAIFSVPGGQKSQAGLQDKSGTQELPLIIKPAMQLKQVVPEQFEQGYRHFYAHKIVPLASTRLKPGTQREQAPFTQVAHPGEHLTH